MKRTFLVIISIVLLLASAFGFYAAYVGLDDVPGIQRNKNLQAADIEDAIDLIEENLDEYNEMVALQEEMDKAEAEKAAAEAAEGAEGTAAATSATTPGAVTNQPAARVNILKPARTLAPSVAAAQDQFNQAQQNVNNCQAAYDAASQKVANSQAQLDAAQESLSSNQAKAGALSNSVNNAVNAQSAYNQAKANYDNTPYWLYSSKAQAKSAMDSAEANYRASLNGYGSVGDMQAALNSANQAVNSSKSAVSSAGQQLANDQQALNTAKHNLDSANSQLSSARANLDAAQAAQNNTPSVNPNTNTGSNTVHNNGGIISNIINKADNPDKDKEDAEKAEKDAEETAEKLKKLKEYDDVKAIVEEGTEILLDNEDIASRVTDKEDVESVLTAAREYLDETTDSVNKELTLRNQLYVGLEVLSVVGAVAALLGIVAAIAPKRFLFVISTLGSLIAALSAAALNVYGFLGNYTSFKYARVNGNGDGRLQLYGMLAMLGATVLSFIVVAICSRSFKKALKKRQMRDHLIQETEKAAKRRAEKQP